MNDLNLVTTWQPDPVDTMRREQKTREMLARVLGSRPADHRHELAREAEGLAAARLRSLGYGGEKTAHRAPYDFLVNGCLRVEVKVSNWRQQPGRRGGRYQANIHNSADLVIFLARGGTDTWFVMPMAIAGRSVTIRDYRADRTAGKYAPYLGAWGLVGWACALASGRARQLGLGVA